MENSIKILLIALVLSLIFLITLRIFNTISLSKITIREINSADSNIASSKIEDFIEKFKKYLKIDNYKIIYGDTENYCQINQMFNKRKKIINIPKWIMPSVGYELDYILASIWYNAKLIQKDKTIKKIEFFLKWWPIFFYTLYYLTFILSIVIFFINKEQIIQLTGSKFLIFIFKFPIIQIISLLSFLSIIIMIFYVNTFKIKIEEKYEREIVAFVKNELESYKTDITAARIYAREFGKLHFKIIKFNAKTLSLKFVGPFTFL